MLGALAGAGLAALIFYLPPATSSVALAIFLVLLTVMGFSTPVWRLVLHKILPKQNNRKVDIMSWRFGLWSGIFIASLVLLKILGFMDRVLILAILALLIMLEMFLQQNSVRKQSTTRSRR